MLAADSDAGTPNCVKVELTRGEEMAAEKSTTCGSEVRAAGFSAAAPHSLPGYEYDIYHLYWNIHIHTNRSLIGIPILRQFVLSIWQT